MAGQYPVHEGLQVARPDHTSHAPEVYLYRYHDAAPETASQGYVHLSPEKAEPHQERTPLAAAQPRRLCGLPKRTALIVAAVVALVIIGAVVGGVAGALVARNGTGNASNASNASSTSANPGPDSTHAADAAVTSASTATSSASTASTSATSTSTSTSSAFPTPTNNILPLNCPAINNTQFTVQGESFLVYCLTDFKSGSGNIAQSLEASIGECIGSCVTYNSENENTDSPCQGLTFGANLTRYGGANCFLKTGPLARKPYTIDDFQAGAVLLG